ncbi:MAG: thioredoxin family protein [Verrucomicrobia bacterium]|jgi:thioredoxin 1|nr:thioredoxin family protein [Verrucomicrobiota bacterium]
MQHLPFRFSAFSTGLLLISLVFACGCRSIEKPKPDGRHARQIYDMGAEGAPLLQSAIAEAKQENKNILLSLGANWCSDSQNTYDALLQNPQLKQLIEEHYILTLIDVNNRVGHQRNSPLISRYGVDLERGIPALLVLTPSGELMTKDPDQRPKDSDHEEPQKLVEYLERWKNR